MRSRPALWALAASSLVLAACGTRLPDTAFVQAQQQAAGPQVTGPSGEPLPGVSPGPGGAVIGGGRGSGAGPSAGAGGGGAGRGGSGGGCGGGFWHGVGRTGGATRAGSIGAHARKHQPL